MLFCMLVLWAKIVQIKGRNNKLVCLLYWDATYLWAKIGNNRSFLP